MKVDFQPALSLVNPAFNEADVINQGLINFPDYLVSIEKTFRCGILIVHVGSPDENRRMVGINCYFSKQSLGALS